MALVHREPYITLAGLTETSALIAWGAFFFDVTGQELDGRFKIIEDRDLKFLNPPRKTSIGESSEPYGPATLRVWEKNDNSQVIEVSVDPKPKDKINHVWVKGLKPNTSYLYSLTVRDAPWAEEERRDWVLRNGKQGLLPNKGVYKNDFRTYPAANAATPNFAFAVIGDFGRGVRKESTATSRQREIAEALALAVEEKNVRFVLTTGDNVYSGGGSDSDWFFTFYQPYRYVLNRIPFYPSCGNHDTGETEGDGSNVYSDDYDELLDNFYIRERFLAGDWDEGNALKDRGLFYAFNFGKDVEFISIDSAQQQAGQPMAFERPENLEFVKSAIPDKHGAATTVWRVPFFHHPAYCDGPVYGNSTRVIEQLVPIFEKGGVRLVFNGHDHNFQVSRTNGIHYVITGGAGEVRTKGLNGNEDAHNIAWSPAPHLVLCEYNAGRFELMPYGELKNGKLQPLSDVVDPNGDAFQLPPLTLE
jgi:tartrate-resistant acid phosphatase type 5